MMVQSPSMPIYAGFWRRAGALAVDGVIHYLLFVIVLIAALIISVLH